MHSQKQQIVCKILRTNELWKRLELKNAVQKERRDSESSGILLSLVLKLKQFQLLSGRIGALWFRSVENINVAKLFVGDTDDTDIPELGKKRLHPFFMHFGIFHTGAVADVDGKLKHRKAVFYQVFPKCGIGFFLLLRFGGQVKQYQQPHNSVFAESFCNHSSSG